MSLTEENGNNDTETFTTIEEREVSKKKSVRTGVLVSAVGIGMFMSALDESIINVSMVNIAEDFKTDQTHIQWIILVYLSSCNC